MHYTYVNTNLKQKVGLWKQHKLLHFQFFSQFTIWTYLCILDEYTLIKNLLLVIILKIYCNSQVKDFGQVKISVFFWYNGRVTRSIFWPLCLSFSCFWTLLQNTLPIKWPLTASIYKSADLKVAPMFKTNFKAFSRVHGVLFCLVLHVLFVLVFLNLI